MPHVDSAMYSTTWSILQHYRDSVIMEDEDDFDTRRRPSSPASQFQIGNPFESKKRRGSNGSIRRRYDFTPDSLSPASPRSSSPENGYASSQTSASSYNEKRRQQRREIRARRSPKGSQNWPADLKLKKTNGATQMDEPNLPRWKYSPRQMNREDVASPPPLPPKNKLRNSMQRFSNGSDQGASGFRRPYGEQSPESRPRLRVDIPDETAGMSLRQGTRRPDGRSRDNSYDDNTTNHYRDESSTGLRKTSEQKKSHFSPDLSASANDEYNPYANPFAPRKDSREQQTPRERARYPARDDSFGNRKDMMSPRRVRNDSVDSFGDPKSARNPMRQPRRVSTSSNYVQSPQNLAKAIRSMRSPSEYGSPGAPPSAMDPKSSKRQAILNKDQNAAGNMTFSNLATPFSQPDYSQLNPGPDASFFSPPPRQIPPPRQPEANMRHRRDLSEVSPRSGVPQGLPNPRMNQQEREEPRLSAMQFRNQMEPSNSPPPPPPPPKVGLPTGPRDMAASAPRLSHLDASKPLPLKPNRRGPPKVSELPKEPPKSFNMAPVTGMRRPSPPETNNSRMADSSPRDSQVSLRQRMKLRKGGRGNDNDRTMDISSPTLIEGPVHRDLGELSPAPRYGGAATNMSSDRLNPYGNPFAAIPTPTGPPQGYLSSHDQGGMRSNNSGTASSPSFSRDTSTRSGFSHTRVNSTFSSASSNNSIPVGTSAFGRLSSGTGAGPTSNPSRRGAPSPGPPQHLNVTSDSGPYLTSASRGPFPPKAPSSGAGMNRSMPSPGQYPPSGMQSPMLNQRPMPGSNPRAGPPLPGHPGVGVTPLAHKRMASNFSSASGPGRVDQRRPDPNLAAAVMGGGPYPNSAPNSGGLSRRDGPPLPGPPMPMAQQQQPAPPMRGPQGPPPGARAPNGRPLPPGAGFGLPGMPRNVRAGVPGRQPIMRV